LRYKEAKTKEKALLARAGQMIAENDLLAREERVVLGVSGGPDSVGLLYLLQGLGLGLKLHIAHLNHLIRGAEAEEDARFVEGLAEKLGLPATIETRDVPRAHKRWGGSLEEAARRVRYAFLEEVAQKAGAKKIALGHTADDQVETILQHILKGTGLRGLRGMLPRRPLHPASDVFVIRPLLGIWHQEIEEYLEEKRIAFRRDKSNVARNFLRNRLRHELLPFLQADYNKGVKEAILRLGEQAQMAYDFLREKVEEAEEKELPQVSRPTTHDSGPETADIGHPTFVDAGLLLGLHPAVASELIREIAARLGAKRRDFNLGHFKETVQLARGETGKAVHLPGGVRVVKEYGRLRFETADDADSRTADVAESESPDVAEGVISIPGRAVIPDLGLEFEVETIGKEDFKNFLKRRNNRQEAMDRAGIKVPLRVRFRRAGDRFWPLGAKGEKKLKDFFIDQKVPRRLRDRIPLVVSGDRVIWVVGYRIDERVKVTEKTEEVIAITVRKR
jgi:tRNA(Ile)-lysidine synthase